MSASGGIRTATVPVLPAVVVVGEAEEAGQAEDGVQDQEVTRAPRLRTLPSPSPTPRPSRRARVSAAAHTPPQPSREAAAPDSGQAWLPALLVLRLTIGPRGGVTAKGKSRGRMRAITPGGGRRDLRRGVGRIMSRRLQGILAPAMLDPAGGRPGTEVRGRDRIHLLFYGTCYTLSSIAADYTTTLGVLGPLVLLSMSDADATVAADEPPGGRAWPLVSPKSTAISSSVRPLVSGKRK